MIELDEATRRALLAREGPPPLARAEILAGLRTRLGGPAGPDDPSGEPDPAGGESIPFDGGAAAGAQIAWAAKVVGATLGLAAAGLLTIKLGAVTIDSLAGSPAPEPARVATTAPASSTIVEPHEQLDEPALPEQPVATPNTEATPVIAAVGHREPSKAESTLAAELELVRAAKQLRADDPEAALGKLDLHGQRFPDGSLAPEREAIRVELLCVLGRDAALAEARANFLQHHADSPLRARVLASCEKSGTDPAGAGD
jgi:hypothetical protein